MKLKSLIVAALMTAVAGVSMAQTAAPADTGAVAAQPAAKPAHKAKHKAAKKAHTAKHKKAAAAQ